MTLFSFKGKEAVYNHHLAVPYRPLVADGSKGVGEVDLSGNLIVQGDNLHGLKSLMPLYGGKVDCVFIDPPYNTGNEGWSYNDNVHAPHIQEWLEANPIATDDQLRHDKWCAMMFPRLRLLHELLADTGIIFISIDDNEQANLKLICDSIFGEGKFLGTFVWETKRAARGNPPVNMLMHNHEYVLAYSKGNLVFKGENRKEEDFSNNDNDPRGLWRSESIRATGSQNNLFSITNPKNGIQFHGNWAFSKQKIDEMIKDDLILFPDNPNRTPRQKKFIDSYTNETKAIVTHLGWYSTEKSTKKLMDIFGGKKVFDFPKPMDLIRFFIEQSTDSNGLILDSFAGSGTTAHAVLEANKRDGGNRRFILVEMEDHIADAVTAERVRRVIKGYGFAGTQKTELYRQKLNWNSLKKADEWVSVIDRLEQQQGATYDTIKKEVKNNELIVTGEKKVTDKTEGLGGSFTFCTLGAALELDAILTGKTLPTAAELAPIVFHMATGETLKTQQMKLKDFYLGHTQTAHVWMYYKPDLEWLKSTDAALTLERARQLQATDTTKEHLVLSAANYISRDLLHAENLTAIRHVPLPYALFQRLKP